MKIWLINHYAVPPQYYPLARQNYFARYLMQAGHEVTIFAASTVHNSDLNLIEDNTPYREDVVDGVHYVLIRCKGYRGNGISRILNMLEFARKLPGVCNKYPRPDAIVATSMPPMSCAAGIKLARKYGCRGIAEIADLWPESIVAYGIAGPRNPADYILEQGWEREIPRSKVHYINNGVDLEQFRYNREHFTVDDPDLTDPDTFKVIYTGSIRKVNNLGLLLDAAKELRDPRVRFLIWGDGDEREALQQRVAEENISNVVFKGRVEKKYVPYITSCADLNIAHNTPSSLFRFGISFNKLFDYLAAGKPVLSDFPCPYNPAVLLHASLCVDDPTAQNIAQAVTQAAAMEREQYNELCSNAEKAAVEYDFRNLTNKLLQVING